MSISITIDAHPDMGPVDKQINDAMAALGFVPRGQLDLVWKIAPEDAASAAKAVSRYAETVESDVGRAEEVTDPATGFPASDVDKAAMKRTPGQPSPGAKRRTKAEIAEDEAAALASAQNVDAIKADVLAGAAEQQAAYDSPEDIAQDAADEAAEVAATKKGLTLDDLRHAAGRYQKKFGMAAAVAGVPALLGCAIVDVPESELAAAIAKIDNAVAGDAPGPIEEKVAEQPAEKPATKEDLMAAMLRYALKFDGQNTDMTAMPFAMADCPAIFKLLFGDGVEKLSQVPVEGYTRTIAAIDEAIAKDPFKRGAK